MAACESPTRATVVGEAVSPPAHSACPTSRQDRVQPLTNTAALSAGALASDGSRFDGTARRSADAATASRACANAWRTAASFGVAAGGGGGGRAKLVALGGAPPVPPRPRYPRQQQQPRPRRDTAGEARHD